jgi:hypothetical protein
MLGAILQRASAVVVDGGTLVVTFGPADSGMVRMLAGDDNARSIEAIAGEALGRPLGLRVRGSDETASAPAGTAAPDSGVPRPPRDDGAESRLELTDRAKKDPVVSRVLSEFGAQVVDVRPLRPAADDAPAPPSIEENG